MGRSNERFQNAALGAGLGWALVEGGINTSSALVGMTGGAIIGQSLSNDSNSFSLKRSVISEIRSEPVVSKLNLDASFKHREKCIEDPTIANTNINIANPIPLRLAND